MAPWFEVLTTAFLLQLLALPGEKGQLVVAALATRYNPYRVVAGAATAFGGWTAVEILVGEALTEAFPEVYLDALTAALFVGFAAVIVYSQLREGSLGDVGSGGRTAGEEGGALDDGTPDADDAGKGSPDEAVGASPGTDGAVASPASFEGLGDGDGGYLAALSAMGFAEFGDKTQLVTIGLAVQYGAHPAIWVGEMLAIVPVSLLVALVFHRTARLLNRAWVHYVAAATFLLFAADIAAGYVLGFSLLPL